MMMLNIKRKKRKGKWRRRFQARFPYESAIKEIYRYFMRPFLDVYSLHEGEREFQNGLAYFFNSSTRKVFFCAVIKTFKLPGRLWERGSPARLIPGTIGKRHIIKGTPVVVRIDTTAPLRFADIEVGDNIYSMTEAEYNAISDCFEVIA
jgi:hypothetical protein